MNNTGPETSGEVYDSKPMRPSRVYVLKGLEGGRKLAGSPANTVCQSILRDNYYFLPPHVQAAFDGFMKSKRGEQEKLVKWSRAFAIAYRFDPDGPLPTRRGQSFKATDEKLTIAMHGMLALHEAGARGVTANEVVRSTRIISGGFSGFLSDMHDAGQVVALLEKRL